MIPRRSLINAATIKGRGLFTGVEAEVTFRPALAGNGVTIRSVDVPGAAVGATIHALAEAPAGIPARNTTLRAGTEIITVEHALSALVGLCITDVVVEVRGPEIPILDGSALPFAEALWKAGVRYVGDEAQPLKIDREIVVEGRDGARITARPRSQPGCLYTYQLDYGADGAIPAQAASFDTARTEASYMREVAPARTFCTEAEAAAMQRAGLFKHLTKRDMLVIGPSGPMDNAYRFENEPARHKLLDLMGDLGLVGGPIQAEIIAFKAGHSLNHAMARALLNAAV